jgi:hypothetical protein
MSAITEVPALPVPTSDDVPLDGRVLASTRGRARQDDDHGLRFTYRERGDLVEVRYAGGPVRLGFRVGTRHGNHIAFTYAEVTAGGERCSGRVDARLELLGDGRVRLYEVWSADGYRGEGARVVEEVPAGV